MNGLFESSMINWLLIALGAFIIGLAKAGIKGIATLYKQERWLMDLKLLEKKAKPGPHDGSLYVVHKLESLPLPAEIYEKFDAFLSGLK